MLIESILNEAAKFENTEWRVIPLKNNEWLVNFVYEFNSISIKINDYKVNYRNVNHDWDFSNIKRQKSHVLDYASAYFGLFNLLKPRKKFNLFNPEFLEFFRNLGNYEIMLYRAQNWENDYQTMLENRGKKPLDILLKTVYIRL